MAGRARIDAVLAGLEAAVCTLETDFAGLRIRPDPQDLEAIDFDGALRQAAQRLQARLQAPGLAPEDERVVEGALVKLHLLAEGGRG
jgi:hypothetical protein